jgi:hypothetical protein
VHPIANGTPAATPEPLVAASNVTADIVSAGSPSFTVGNYPGPTSTSTPFATVTPAPHSGSYAALVYTGTGAVADTFAPNTAAQYSDAGVNGICQSFIVPMSGSLTAYVNEGGYETSTTSTETYGDQEGDIFMGDVSSVASEQPTVSLFNELNDQKTSGYAPSYVQKGPYDLTSMGLVPGMTVTLMFATYDFSPSEKYGEYMFVDDVSVSGIAQAAVRRASAPAAPAPAAPRFTTR